MDEQTELTIIIEGLDEFEKTQTDWLKEHLSNESVDNRTLKMDINTLIHIRNIKAKYNKRFDELGKNTND